MAMIIGERGYLEVGREKYIQETIWSHSTHVTFLPIK